MTFSFAKRSWVVVGAIGISACSSSSDGGGKQSGTPPDTPRTPIELAPDTTSADFTWKPETVVIDAETIAANLENAYAEDGVYRFDPTATELAKLSAGTVVVLSGVDLVRVTDVEVTDDAIVLTTEPASIPDAVSDAEVSWDVGVDVSKPIQRNDGSGMLSPLAAPQIVCGPDAAQDSCKSTFSGTLGNLKAEQELETDPDGSLKMKLTIEYPKEETSVLKVVANATVRSFRNEGSLVIHGGSLESAYVTLRDLDMEVDLDAGAVAIGGGDNTFKFPIKLTFPFELGPIPAYLSVKAEIELDPELSNQSSFIARTKFHVHGMTGFRIDGGSITPMGSLDDVGGAPPAVSNVSYISTVTAGFGVLQTFPRVGLGIGLVEKASLEGYIAPKVEVVMNQALKLDGLGLITSSCATVQANFGVFAGGNFRFGKIELEQEKQLFGKTHEVYKEGRAHGGVDPSACE